jgi:flagellar biosynthesis protein FlgN
MASNSPLSTLREEHQLMTSLLEVMKQEQAFLVRADTDGLTEVTPRKSSLITQMAELASARHQALGAAGFAPREAGMEAWLDSISDNEAAALWQSLLAVTAEAKEMNRVNGMLINKQLAHNQNIIHAMRQPSSGGDAAMYGPKGQATGSGPSRRFVVG